MKFFAFFLILMAGACLSAQDIEVGFAARGHDPSAENLVLKVIGSAKHEIRMEAYNLTDSAIIGALIHAQKSGVDVELVHDSKATSEKGDGTPLLLAAGVKVKIATAYAIMHDKVIIVDKSVVECGSFNYSVNAHQSNAENVIVLWSRPDVAAIYLKEWQRLWDEVK